MADYLGGIAAGLGQGANSIISAIPYIIAVGIIAGAGVWWYFQKQYNKDILLFKISGPGFRKIADKAKIVKSSAGVSYWKLRRTKLIADVPPNSCVLPGDKGEFASGYVNTIGEIVWCSPGYNPDTIAEKLKKITEIKERNKKKIEAAKTGGTPVLEPVPKLDAYEESIQDFLKAYKPVTTSQRASYANQQDKANKELKFDWLKQNFPILLGGVFIILFILVLGMMWGKFMGPLQERAAQAEANQLEYEKVQLKQYEILERIEGVVQRLEVVDNISNSAVAPPPGVNG